MCACPVHVCVCCAPGVYDLNLFLAWIGRYILPFIGAMQFVRNVVIIVLWFIAYLCVYFIFYLLRF